MQMNTYRMLVRETGGAEPLELTAEMISDLRVVDFARQRLAADPRILEIDVWAREGRLCRLQRSTAAPLASAVQLGIVAEDALFVERKATRGG